MQIFEYMSLEVMLPLVNREVFVLPLQKIDELSAEYAVLVSAYAINGKAIFRKYLVGKTESWNKAERAELLLKTVTIRRLTSEECRLLGLKATMGVITPVQQHICKDFEPLLEGQILNGI